MTQIDYDNTFPIAKNTWAEQENPELHKKAINYFVGEENIMSWRDIRDERTKHTDFIIEVLKQDYKYWTRVECKCDGKQFAGIALEVCGATEDPFWLDSKHTRLQQDMQPEEYSKYLAVINDYVFNCGRNPKDGLLCCNIESQTYISFIHEHSDNALWMDLYSLQRWFRNKLKMGMINYPIFFGRKGNDGYVSFGFSITIDELIQDIWQGEIIGKVDSVKTIMGII